MAYRYLYLVRHAQFNPNFKENPEGKLTKLGRRQARHLVKAFKEISLTTIHVSTMPRTLETAAPLHNAYPDVKVERTRRLWEIIPPVTNDVRIQYFSRHGNEELDHYRDRAQRAYDHYVRRTIGEDKHEVLLCHGNLIRYFVCRAMRVDVTAWTNLVITNCGITRIIVEPDGYIALVSYNETAHLPRDLLTDNMYEGPL